MVRTMHDDDDDEEVDDVDGIDNDDENEFRASPVIEANDDRIIVVWSETNLGSGASTDQDIVYSVSTNDGTSWSAGTSTLSSTGEHSSAGSSASGLVLQGLGGAHRFQKWTGGFITGSADTYNNFSQNPTGRYLLTKKLQANYSPGTSGGVTSGSSDGYGGGY